MKVLLASASPRRLELLKSVGIDVDVRAPHVDETPRPGEAADALVLRLAIGKAAAVLHDGIVVAADTAVVLDGIPLGKPMDAADAERMLHRLSGRGHEVLTGFCVRHGTNERTGVVRTEVIFRPLGKSEIAGYAKSGEPLDKAGAYGIQGRGGALVDRVFGSYTNVIGLPIAEVLAAIREVA